MALWFAITAIVLTCVVGGSLEQHDVGQLRDDFAATIAGHAVIGTEREVGDALIDIIRTLPVDPLIIRPQWPLTTVDEVVAQLRLLGREVIPRLRAEPPTSGLQTART